MVFEFEFEDLLELGVLDAYKGAEAYTAGCALKLLHAGDKTSLFKAVELVAELARLHAIDTPEDDLVTSFQSKWAGAIIALKHKNYHEVIKLALQMVTQINHSNEVF